MFITFLCIFNIRLVCYSKFKQHLFEFGFHGTYCGIKLITTTVATTQKPGQTLIYKPPCTSQYSRFYYDYVIQTTRIWEHILKFQAEGFSIFLVITGQRKVIATTEYTQWRTTYINKQLWHPQCAIIEHRLRLLTEMQPCVFRDRTVFIYHLAMLPCFHLYYFALS